MSLQIEVFFMSPSSLYISIVSAIDMTCHSRVKVGRLMCSYYRHLLPQKITWNCARITRQSGNLDTMEGRIV